MNIGPVSVDISLISYSFCFIPGKVEIFDFVLFISEREGDIFKLEGSFCTYTWFKKNLKMTFLYEVHQV